MFNDSINSLVYLFQRVFGFFDSFQIVPGVSILGVLIAFFVILLIIDNFIVKGK